jgi:hypothetical protein
LIGTNLDLLTGKCAVIVTSYTLMRKVFREKFLVAISHERPQKCKLWTDKKENHISLIYKEIQNGAVAKSYMTNGLLENGKIYVHFLLY